MRDHAVALFPKADLYISTGAIADIEFDVASEKIKKESMTTALEYHQAADILKEILALKNSNQKVVSFAAETQTTPEVFQEKMNRKPVDLMVGNKVANGLVGSDKVEGFQTENGNYFFVTTKEIQGPFALTKKEVGLKLVSWFEGK
jgi:phosphopantothenoylcysteine decarboxylase/phosphopantothenate--cysteine ligase